MEKIKPIKMKGSVKLGIAIGIVLLIEYVMWLCSGEVTDAKVISTFTLAGLYLYYCVEESIWREDCPENDDYTKYTNIFWYPYKLIMIIINLANKHL